MTDCPRCDLKLQEETYESVESLFCNQCWGHWMTEAAFTQIMKDETNSFSDAERKSVLRTLAEKGVPDLVSDGVIHCPVCKKQTEKKQFSDGCPVLLDLCPEHGVWLDATEIKQLQVYFETLDK